MLALLTKQVEGLRVTKREHSGVGCFVELAVQPASRLTGPFPPRLAITDVDVSISGLRTGAGIVLFAEDGALALLEAFTYEEPWLRHPVEYSFSYRDPARSHAELAAMMEMMEMTLPPWIGNPDWVPPIN